MSASRTAPVPRLYSAAGLPALPRSLTEHGHMNGAATLTAGPATHAARQQSACILRRLRATTSARAWRTSASMGSTSVSVTRHLESRRRGPSNYRQVDLRQHCVLG
jgi:hypothetical protein